MFIVGNLESIDLKRILGKEIKVDLKFQNWIKIAKSELAAIN